MEEDKKPFLEHLEELRQRLIRCLIAVGVAFVICYIFSKEIFALLTIPLREALPEGSSMIFTNLPEAFFTYLKLSFFSGIFLAFPYILYQAWLFVAPGLYAHEKRYLLPFLIFATFFFVAGAAFGYFVVFPYGFRFFLGFSTDFIRPAPKVKEYLSFSLTLLLAFGVVFELPVFIFFLSRMGVVDHRMLARNRRYAILIIFIAAAIFTPPDVITQLMMAAPLLVLYELSVWVAKVFGRKRPVEDEG
ncbi:MAG TPA: twin-arginine translocase subunit TatC [Deltaproteobacteria bacterium]|nr:twin-arginine translocase subunit TatC [Deltaproteobacteria bacterium]